MELLMCLYPKLILNRKYCNTKKNGYSAPALEDERVRYVPVKCGNCIECKKEIARNWQVRLHEEIKVQTNAYFITLSFSNEALEKLMDKYKIRNVNAIATKATRLFLERIRKNYRKSIKHWMITELGQTRTERIHIHGIIFPSYEINNEWLQKYWNYGNTWLGDYCTTRTINYIVKYLYKIDPKHKNYKPVILCSSGIGKNYIDNAAKEIHKFRGKDTVEYYKLPNGQKVQLPIYYRNKLFEEKEREKLWIQKIEKDKRYIRGIVINQASKNNEYFNNVLLTAQEENIKLGFGSDGKEWQKEEYNVTLKMLNKIKKM